MAYPNHTARKIWPTGPDYESTPAHGPFSIHFIAEGFVDSQVDKDAFEEKCMQFLNELIGDEGVFPFTLLSQWQWANGFSAYTHFVASEFPVPGSPPAAGNSLFNTYVDSTAASPFVLEWGDAYEIIEQFVIKDIEESGENEVIETEYTLEHLLSPLSYSARIIGVYPNMPVLKNPVFKGLPVIIVKSTVSGNFIGEHYSGGKSPIIMVSSTCNGVGQVLARAIAPNYGLGLELEFDGPEYDHPPTQEEILTISCYENLIYSGTDLSNPISPSVLRWEGLLDNAQRSSTVPLVYDQVGFTKYNPSYSKGYIEKEIKVLIGGAGYRRNVYRPDGPCLMKTEVTPEYNAILFDKTTHFCPVCTAILKHNFTGNYWARRDGVMTMHNQTMKCDLGWQETNTYNNPVVETATAIECDLELGEEYWKYWFHVVQNYTSGIPGDQYTYSGLRIKNISVENQTHRPAGMVINEVLEYIEFVDLKVKFADELNPVPFNINSALSSAKLRHCKGAGWLEDSKIQSAVIFDMEDSFDGTCKVKVSLAVTFRGPRADFEPTQTALALHIYPQISFSWEPIKQSNGSQKTVQHFMGTVRQKVISHHMPGCASMSSPEYQNTAMNYADFYADANNTPLPDMKQYYIGGTVAANNLNLGRKYKFYSPVFYNPFSPHPQNSMDWNDNYMTGPPGTWNKLFDYYMPSETFFDNALTGNDYNSIIAVYGPDATGDMLSKRSGSINYPKDDLEPNWFMKVAKVARQGMYDNLHVSGDMGKSRPPNQAKRVLAAPLCAEDCFHTHWRWGSMAEDVASLPNPLGYFNNVFPDPSTWMQKTIKGQKVFRGWSKNVVASTAHTEINAPMIPPNQEMIVTIRNIALEDNLKKIVDFTVKVYNPVPGEQQVINHHGSAYAVGVTNTIALRLLYGSPLFNVQDPFDGSSFLLDDYQIIRQVYLRWRFFDHCGSDAYFGETDQVPAGDLTFNEIFSTLENL